MPTKCSVTVLSQISKLMASKWNGGFKQFYCLLRSNLGSKYNLDSLAEICGTVHGLKPQGKPDASMKFRQTRFPNTYPPLVFKDLSNRYAQILETMG